ncbi:putative PHO87 protein [Anopheles sinensis]|uniref:Putative PHO87 protein n=1 Tax=Anopheles sinensis TaxID=74873 RepID=A0A084VYH5_ANOSI|nr:putative PHO87 protein [Anopheles sinensis]
MPNKKIITRHLNLEHLQTLPPRKKSREQRDETEKEKLNPPAATKIRRKRAPEANRPSKSQFVPKTLPVGSGRAATKRPGLVDKICMNDPGPGSSAQERIKLGRMEQVEELYLLERRRANPINRRGAFAPRQNTCEWGHNVQGNILPHNRHSISCGSGDKSNTK